MTPSPAPDLSAQQGVVRCEQVKRWRRNPRSIFDYDPSEYKSDAEYELGKSFSAGVWFFSQCGLNLNRYLVMLTIYRYRKFFSPCYAGSKNHPATNVPSKLHACAAAQLLKPLCAVTTTLCAVSTIKKHVKF